MHPFERPTLMRYQGRVVIWHDDKGFGFVARNGSEEHLPLHVSALADENGRRPCVGDLLTWTEGEDERGRLQATQAAFVGGGGVGRFGVRDRHERPSGWLPRIAGLTAALMLAVVVWNRADPAKENPLENVLSQEPVRRGAFGVKESVMAVNPSSSGTRGFQCEAGKVHCSQMRSCAEAEFYVENCPGTKMDGDHDGDPCERGPC
ncbi:MAG: excalibur calcium-binding domain-containing protein [Dokdonella sp.]